tara:strand:- start:140 stop:364 length:225 start_codon:yes stop_codon:yes gene_type:complete
MMNDGPVCGFPEISAIWVDHLTKGANSRLSYGTTTCLFIACAFGVVVPKHAASASASQSLMLFVKSHLCLHLKF